MRLDTIVNRATTHQSLPGISHSVRRICAAVKAAASAPAPETEEARVELEGAFLSALSLDDLLTASTCAPLWLWIESLITHRFSGLIHIPTSNDVPGPRSLRVGVGLVRRLEAEGLIEIEDASEDYIMHHDTRRRRYASQLDGGSDGTPAPAGTASIPASPGTDNESRRNAPVYNGIKSDNSPGDIARNRRAVQSAFSDKPNDDLAKFSGDLSKGISYELWEKRYRSLVTSLNLPEVQRVQFLAEALSVPALTFFYDEICPDDSRAGNSLPEAALSIPINMAPNITTLSGAFAALKKRFCTDAARNVLKQELDQLTLSAIEREEQVSKPQALSILKDRIRRLSANGPTEFSSEPCMIAALHKSLEGEEWAVEPIINATDRASKSRSDKTLEHYVQTLISYLRTKETLSGSKSMRPQVRQNPSVPVLMTEEDIQTRIEEAFYGDARAQPRRNRTYQGLPLRQSYPRRDSSGSTSQRPSSNWPPGIDLHRMLARPPQQATTQNASPPARTRPRGSCWNCDRPGHFARDCKQPRRSNVQLAHAMVIDDVPPMEMAVYFAREADHATAYEQHANGENDTPVFSSTVDDDHNPEADEEDRVQAFETLMAAVSREAHPGQDFC